MGHINSAKSRILSYLSLIPFMHSFFWSLTWRTKRTWSFSSSSLTDFNLSFANWKSSLTRLDSCSIRLCISSHPCWRSTTSWPLWSWDRHSGQMALLQPGVLQNKLRSLPCRSHLSSGGLSLCSSFFFETKKKINNKIKHWKNIMLYYFSKSNLR